ncbi:16171_t:CDS:2 [Cetraspora pellucida]|uniref:16171_t:CDS:1 n=1 Tax=Cetraspora pellucida TaxID=1433469 RepID=A0ACA9NKT1_9GLOM|nr:16171_t:CDS:2 [Cetraspora pellucida]
MSIPAGFALPLLTQSQRWYSFYRSEIKGAGNRYTAKCKYCLRELSGKPERLHRRVLQCSDYPVAEKTIYLQKITEESLPSRKCIYDNEDSISIEQTDHSNMQHLSISQPHQKTIVDCHFQEKLNTLSILIDYTISLDGWTDNSGNSIYCFMALKECQETVLDILDLSAYRYKGDFLKNKVKEVLTLNGIQISSAIACDIVGFFSIVSVCKKNQKLVNFFNASHIWHREMQNWQKQQGLYGVSAYEKGFRHCLLLSKTERPKYPEIENATVKNIIRDRYHFANNEALTKVIKPIVDAIGRLESSDSSLADVFKELIYIYQHISQLEIPINGLKDHALATINKRAKEFDSDIYFVAFFLFPAYKKIATLKKMSGENIIHASMESKERNKLTPDSLSMIGQLRHELKKDIPIKNKKQNRAVPNLLSPNNSHLSEELEEVIMEQNNMSVMEEFFDFTVVETNQDTLDDDSFSIEPNRQPIEDEWSIDKILEDL